MMIQILEPMHLSISSKQNITEALSFTVWPYRGVAIEKHWFAAEKVAEPSVRWRCSLFTAETVPTVKNEAKDTLR